jgi:hypothetical protein
MMTPAREWKCDGCGLVEMQTGPRAAELLPSPPERWISIDKTELLPARVVGQGDQKVKVGASRETSRRAYCPACRTKFD